MILLWVLLLSDADTRLAELRKHFSLPALEQLAEDSRGTEAGGQAAAWRGAVAKQGGDFDAAARWFQLAETAPPGGEARRQAARGLGDLDVAQRRYGDALGRYREAAPGASPILAEELKQKSAVAEKLLQRQRWEWLAWTFLMATFGYFLWRARRGEGRLRPPLEAIYVLPVYVLLYVGALGRDPAVARALGVGGALSLALIATVGLAARRTPPGRRLLWLQALLLVTANLALFYAILNRTGLVDTLILTTQM
jgi:hypothetical protein